MIFFTLVGLFLFFPKSYTQTTVQERQIKVSMRMIGHQVLLHSGDSTSRVLPIEKEVDRYKIQFESDFHFSSEELVTIVDQIVKETKMTTSYLVEVEECETKEVVYSYMIGGTPEGGLIPCRKRAEYQGCYRLFFTILDSNETALENSFVPSSASNELASASSGKKLGNYFLNIWTMFPFLILMGLFFYFWKKGKRKERAPKMDSDMISIGKYQFDKKNRALSHDNKKTELTSKETDLLFLLYTSANRTLERDNILKIVWGDEGDYIGRTLDVFISKLRKKLAADSNLKIVNIRGVGYKFVVNG